MEEEKMKGVVYEAPCGDVYGETARNLRERLKEHQYAVEKKGLKNRIAAWNCNTCLPTTIIVDWSAAKLRCTEWHHWKSRILKAIHGSNPYPATGQHFQP